MLHLDEDESIHIFTLQLPIRFTVTLSPSS